MKRKPFKKLLSLAIAIIMCVTMLQTAFISVGAASVYDAEITLHYPRPNEKPSSDIKISSSTNYELVGYAWSDNNGNETVGPASFKSFYLMMEGVSEETINEIKNFTDTINYNMTLIYKIKNKSVALGTQCDVSVKADGIDVDVDCGLVPAQMLINQLPSGSSVPSDLFTKDDTILMVSLYSMTCSPTDHVHEIGEQGYDENAHFKTCAVCGEKMLSTTRSHRGYFTTDYELYFKETLAPTDTNEGLWEYFCDDCGYAMDRVEVPAKNDQTFVSTYDELKNALANGGTQWITLTQNLSQKDAVNDNMFSVTDPYADITLDLNGHSILRDTLYDRSMFKITAGKLKVIQKDMSNINIGGSSLFANLGYFTGSTDSSVFRVEQGAELEVMNIAPYARSSEYLYGHPTFVSYGNLKIKSGYYCSYVNDAPIVLSRGGDTTIDNGYFSSSFAPCVEVREPDYFTSTLTINDGKFEDSYTTINVEAKNCKVVINNGTFRYENKTYGWTTDYGIYSKAKEITINNGTFYGSKSGAYIVAPQIMNINGGYFKNTSPPDQYNKGALQCDIDLTTKDPSYIISGGEFIGKYGIRIFNNSYPNYGNADFVPKDYISPYSTVYVDDKMIDLTKTVKYLGTETVSIRNNTPKLEIISQPTKSSCKSGGTASLSVYATGVKDYLWQYYNGGMWFDLTDELISMLSGVTITGNYTPALSVSLKGNSSDIFRCKLTGYDGTVLYSNSAAMIFGGKPTITEFKETTLTSGTNGTLSVRGTNIEEVNWVFMVSGKYYSLNEIKDKYPESTFYERINTSGTYAAIGIINVPKALNTARYAVTVKNDLGNATSDFVRINVNDPEPEFLLGDANSDGSVSIYDVTTIQNYLAKKIELDSTQILAADADEDTVVSIYDATMIQQYLAHMIDHLGK